MKGNQHKLKQAIKMTCSTDVPMDSYVERQKVRGREEYRKTEIYAACKQSLPSGWNQLNTMIRVERKFISKHKTHHYMSYYISSLPPSNAKQIAKGIRGHWLIENRLHWVKDVSMGEDKSYIKNENASKVMSVLRNIAINVCQNNGYKSIKKAQILFAANVMTLNNILRT